MSLPGRFKTEINIESKANPLRGVNVSWFLNQIYPTSIFLVSNHVRTALQSRPVFVLGAEPDGVWSPVRTWIQVFRPLISDN
jgi:hypothetical protein